MKKQITCPHCNKEIQLNVSYTQTYKTETDLEVDVDQVELPQKRKR